MKYKVGEFVAVDNTDDTADLGGFPKSVLDLREKCVGGIYKITKVYEREGIVEVLVDKFYEVKSYFTENEISSDRVRGSELNELFISIGRPDLANFRNPQPWVED